MYHEPSFPIHNTRLEDLLPCTSSQDCMSSWLTSSTTHNRKNYITQSKNWWRNKLSSLQFQQEEVWTSRWIFERTLTWSSGNKGVQGLLGDCGRNLLATIHSPGTQFQEMSASLSVCSVQSSSILHICVFPWLIGPIWHTYLNLGYLNPLPAA